MCASTTSQALPGEPWTFPGFEGQSFRQRHNPFTTFPFCLGRRTLLGMSTYAIDTSHSEIGFTVRHMVVAKVRGQFKTWTGSVALEGEDFTTAKVNVEVDVASIDTREEKRDGHLKSADFFDVEKHPKLTFASTKVEKKGERYAVHGDLTIHGVTKGVTLDAEFLGKGKDPWGNDRLAFSAETQIDRKDFGLTWNQALEAGGVLVGEKVTITTEVQLVAAK